MNANEINEIIETLCIKFGIAIENVESLMPEVVGYMKINYSIILIIAILCFVAFLYFLKRFLREHKKYESDYDEYNDVDCAAYAALSAILAFISFIAFFIGIFGLAKWFAMPRMAFMEYLIRMVK